MADSEAEMLCGISRELILIQHQCHVNNCHTVLSREEHWGKVCAFGTEGDIFSIFDWWLLTPRIQSLHTLRTDVPMHVSVVVTLTFVPVINLFLLYCILRLCFWVCVLHTHYCVNMEVKGPLERELILSSTPWVPGIKSCGQNVYTHQVIWWVHLCG